MTTVTFKNRTTECVGAHGHHAASGVSIAHYDTRQEVRLQTMMNGGDRLLLSPCIISIPATKETMKAVIDSLSLIYNKL